jgi:hypothetical protein
MLVGVTALGLLTYFVLLIVFALLFTVRRRRWPTSARATDPEGQEWDLSVNAVGVTMEPISAGGLVWPISWVVHGLRYRGQWEVHVDEHKRWGKPQFWIYEGYRSKADARAAIPHLVEKIESGTWTPGDPLMAGE